MYGTDRGTWMHYLAHFASPPILNTNQLTALGASSGHDQLKALAGSSGHDQLRALENAFAMHLLLTVRASSRASSDEAEPTVTRTRPDPLIDRCAR
jgi:hypothetical protein